MRIISGIYKGKRLTAPKKLPVRPTTDMAKEALFNILNHQFRFTGLEVIDLFSGTGNIAYEFASRGADKVVAVDGNYDCIKFINQTAKELEFNINVFKSDVYKFLEKTPEKCDIIFADPPYDFEIEKFQKIAEITFERELLLEDGILIIEHSKHTDLSNTPRFREARRYGGSVFSFFE